MKNVLLLCFVLLFSGLTSAQTNGLLEAEEELRNRAFQRAEALLAKVDAGEAADYVMQLRALAAFHQADYPTAIRHCDAVMQMRDSVWSRKALFLKAQAHIQLKQHEAAKTIYAAEAARLFELPRKEAIAGRLLELADELAAEPDADDLAAPPPNYAQALSLYQKVAASDIGRAMKDEVRFKEARTYQKMTNYTAAQAAFQRYLNDHDPDWLGVVGSPERLRGEARINPPKRGLYSLQARFHLVECQLAICGQSVQIIKGQRHQREVPSTNPDVALPLLQVARQNAEDLIILLADSDDAVANDLLADARWLAVRSYNLPTPSSVEREQGIAALRAFMKVHPRHPRATDAGMLIARTWQAAGRTEEAIQAYLNFAAGRGYEFVAEDELKKGAPTFLTGESCSETFDAWKKEATYQVGVIHLQQRAYEAAIKQLQTYIVTYPNGSHWSQCQSGIINASFQLGVEMVADKRYEAARAQFESFLKTYPLDARSRQILFLFGQMHVAEADRLEEAGQEEAGKAELQKAIAQWARLASKYPNTEEANQALYRSADLQETRLGEWEQALVTFNRLKQSNWGTSAARVSVLVDHFLSLRTERTFRRNEEAVIALTSRNVEQVSVEVYAVNLEAYFRKMHEIGGLEALDIDLIEPDRVWTVAIEDYKKYKLHKQDIPIPFPEGEAGAFVVRVVEDDFEATTLIIRSDLDLIAQSSADEVIAFVQDRVNDQPAAGVEVLVSDGSKVIAVGKTDKDGIFHTRFDAENKPSSARVFVTGEAGVASGAIGLGDLNSRPGLSERAYIYTDKPAYNPGETVSLRAVIRLVEEDSYVVPTGRVFHVSILDAQGRLLQAQNLPVSTYGTLHDHIQLAATAAVGSYSIRITDTEKPARVFSGSFTVESFQLPRMKLDLAFDKAIYRRGDVATVTITAQTLWGTPLAHKQVTYTRPGGLQFTERTDEAGQIELVVPTTGFLPGARLQVSAILLGENLTAQGDAQVASSSLVLALREMPQVVVAGEPFEVLIAVEDAEGNPVGTNLEVDVLQTLSPGADPVLAQVPWIQRPQARQMETRLERRQLTTDPKTGLGRVTLANKQGGRLMVRVKATDPAGHEVSTQAPLLSWGEEDGSRMRLFAPSEQVAVGDTVPLTLHTRTKAALALVTITGSHRISHQVLRIQPGKNALPITFDHIHAPSCSVTVSLLDDRQLHYAAKGFTVERALRVSMKTPAQPLLPGAEQKIEITVTDHRDEPVQAELSLALVNEALMRLFPNRRQPVHAFFHDDQRRDVQRRTVASADFTYVGATRKVLKSVEQEAARLEQAQREVQRLGAIQGGGYGYGGGLQNQPQGGAVQLQSAQRFADPFAAPFSGVVDGSFLSLGRLNDQMSLGVSAQLMQANSSGLAPAAAPPARQDGMDASRWIAAIETDAQGRATLQLELPDLPTGWVLNAIGVTPETLVGEISTNVIARKAFFVELKDPAVLQEGDSLSWIARVYSDAPVGKGPVKVTLKLSGAGPDVSFEKELRLNEQGMGEVVLDPWTVPAGEEIEVSVSAVQGEQSDRWTGRFPLRPWGQEFRIRDGGLTRGTGVASLALPDNPDWQWSWKRLLISVHPGLESRLIDAVLAPHSKRVAVLGQPQSCRVPATQGLPASELLAAVSVLEYARGREVPAQQRAQLLARCRQLSALLVSTQQEDGSWWLDGRADWPTTTLATWSLARCRAAGLEIHPATLAQAEAYLNKVFRGLSSRDNESKTMIQHSLATLGSADFSAVNRLYRERATLNANSLALLAHTFALLERKEEALVVMSLLESTGRADSGLDPRSQVGWKTGAFIWSQDGNETSAIALLVLSKIQPDSELAPKIASTLLKHYGHSGFASGKIKGAAFAGLAAWHGEARAAQEDYKVQVILNDKLLMTLNRDDLAGGYEFAVPAGQILSNNLIRFEMEGDGELQYAATLSGFTPNGKLAAVWGESLKIRSRIYYHDRLLYNQLPLKALSSSPVKNMEIGQRVRVVVDVQDYHNPINEYLLHELYIPAGCHLVPGSLSSSATRVEIGPGKITLYYGHATRLRDVQYMLEAYTPGSFRMLPSVIRNVYHPSRTTAGTESQITILAPGEKSPDAYSMNTSEHYELASKMFADARFEKALSHLDTLWATKGRPSEAAVARMILWIHTQPDFFKAERVVEMFEVLRERNPELYIPFEKILMIGRAYSEIGEFERAWLVYRSTIDSSFVRDTAVSAVLEDMGQFHRSMSYLKELWWEYPDRPQVTASWLAWADELFRRAPEAEALGKALTLRDADADAPDRPEMLAESARMTLRYLTLFPTNPQADDAAFSFVNALFSLEDYPQVVASAEAFRTRYADSEHQTSFSYMAALGYFWQTQFGKALERALGVANEENKDQNYARYITAQIYHTQNKPADAITWYRTVREVYSDAKQSIAYFEEQKLAMDEVQTLAPGEAVSIPLRYRNIRKATFQVYKVDLMKLYLREKNLSKITQIHLAGIAPQLELEVPLGDGKDYRDLEKQVAIDLEDEGAYLIICRGDNLFTSGLVLITPLKLEIQEDSVAGDLRVNVIDQVKNTYVPKVHVKAIGSLDTEFKSGTTDLRGLFMADQLRGKPTVIVRDGQSRYAFYRGRTVIGPSKAQLEAIQQEQQAQASQVLKPAAKQLEMNDYLMNCFDTNGLLNEGRVGNWNTLRRAGGKGVQIKSAF